MTHLIPSPPAQCTLNQSLQLLFDKLCNPGNLLLLVLDEQRGEAIKGNDLFSGFSFLFATEPFLQSKVDKAPIQGVTDPPATSRSGPPMRDLHGI